MSEESAGQELEPLLAELETLAAANAATRQNSLFRDFLRNYYELASIETLKLRSAADLFETARAHWALQQVRKPGATLIEVEPPRAAAASGSGSFAAVRTVIEDMPFLYDSVGMAVRSLGASIDWTVHPVLKVRRGAKHDLQEVIGTLNADDDGKKGQVESLIHIEFEPLPRAEDYKALEQTLRQVMAELRIVVGDYAPMCERLTAAHAALKQLPEGGDPDEFQEAQEFLLWLADNHFTYLGYSEADMTVAGKDETFRTVTDCGLGLLRKGGRFANTEEIIAPQEELSKYTASRRLVVVNKANVRSPIHHPEYMDVVSVRRFNPDGSVAGVTRFLGLFSTEVYTSRPQQIPLLRRKADLVLKRSRLPEESHSGKNLREILHALPRDELFQSSEDELFAVCMGIRALHDRQQLRLFMRRDRYGRYYSCMVYLPRDRYSRELRDRIAQELTEIVQATSLDRSVDFLYGGLARVHYILRTPPGTTIALSTAEVEQRLLVATRSWRDQLREILLSPRKPVPSRPQSGRIEGGAPDPVSVAARFSDAFPPDFTAVISPVEAAADVQYLARLSEQQPVLPRLAVSEAGATLKLYSFRKSIALSDVLPTLENFGLYVIRQEPTEIRPRDSEPPTAGGTPAVTTLPAVGGTPAVTTLWVQEFDVSLSSGAAAPLAAPSSQDFGNEVLRGVFETALLKTWQGEIENDGLNRLVLRAGLNARQVVCLRTVCKYLIQTGLPYSQSYMEQLLADHAAIARLLVKLFETRFDPELEDKKRKTEEMKTEQELDALLDKVATLDGDRVLRAFLAVIHAALRTNYFQNKPYVSVKLNSAMVPELPQPLPLCEIFVYAPEVEGIHLRGSKVARGGLRWSDRRQDFRVEVLGLMKAQTVKNAIIVPGGAKGGFVVKRGDPVNRELWLKQGIECYKTFVRGLLDLTDNRVGDKVVTPARVLRYDEDDPYLVVAADKGTAAFSDIANGLAAEYNFWLGDAFASGGSAGYDHKKMGITAKGAWEAVKRHFREADKDIQNEEFTVVGVGDMSGDVFGNGMLLSRKIKLLAAFDHRHIFIDPNPDPESSFKERERLFALPRSSWDDYNKDLISKGGGVFPRNAKLIKLSGEAQKALDIKKASLTPAELMHAILKAPVDLLWNGGIGSYVKSQHQSHQDCGDRANDAIRVNGRELRCKVVGEGGNLGCTQLGRIEYALQGWNGTGGRINTDSIDNSGGVHSSDREVNIKIPLNRLMLEGQLKHEKRDPLLVRMTDDLAAAVLRDSYVQSACISLMEQGAAVRLDEHINLIRTLERDGLLNRAVEFLPDDETLGERRTRGKGLTRPEISILVSYTKISLNDAMLKSEVADDPFFERDLLGYFPPELVKTYRAALVQHRLRREIVATIMSNAVVNRMGIAFVHRFAEDHGAPRADVLKAYATAHEIYQGDRYWTATEALDGKVPAALQLRLFGRAIGLLKHATTWLITAKHMRKPVGFAVERFKRPIAELESLLPGILPPTYRADWDRAAAAMVKDGTPQALAERLANTMVLGSALDIVELALEAKVPLAEAAGVYFGVGDRLRMLWLLSSIIGLQVQGKWQALARSNLRDDSYRLHRLIAGGILRHKGATPEERIENWAKANEEKVKFGIQRLQELQVSGPVDFLVLAVGVRELRKLSPLSVV